MMPLEKVFLLFFVSFLVTFLWLRYFKYVFPSIYGWLSSSPKLNYYLRCYACVSFWVSVLLFPVVYFIHDDIVWRHLFASISAISFSYHLETSPLFEGFRSTASSLSMTLAVILSYLIFYLFPPLAFAIVISFAAVLFKELFERMLPS